MKKLKTCLALVLSLLTIVVSVPVTSFAETYPEVESIEFEPLSFVEFTNGYYTEVYDYDADDYVKYYKYNDFDTNYTIVLKDGTVLEPDYWGDLEYNGSWYYPSYETDQSYENQWGVGTHTVNVTIMGFEASFDVIIEESPIKSVNIEDVTIVENTHQEYAEDYDGITYNSYNRYTDFDPQFNITLKDGSILEPEYNGEIYYNGEYYSLTYTDDQSYENQWGVGTHTAEATIMGKKASFNVVIEECPVQSVSFDEVKIIENTKGDYISAYDPNTNDYVEYYRYSSWSYEPNYKVTLKDGTILETSYKGGSILYKDKYYYLSCTDNQSYENQWNVGTYTVNATIMNFNTSFNVAIVECPIKSVDFETPSIIEYTNGQYTEDYDYNTGSYVEYFRYTNINPNFTITLKDGTILKSDWGRIDYNNGSYYLSYDDGQSYDNQWSIGTHNVSAEIMGYKTSFNVEIEKCPIKNITFDEIKLIEKADGSYTGDYDYMTGIYTNEYFRYYYKPSFTVTLNDGTLLKPNRDDYIYYKNNSYSLSYDDNQSYENQWGLGAHTVEASIMGYDTSFEVNVIESPYKLLEILDVTPITDNEDCRIDENGNKIFDTVKVVFRVTDKDGNSFLSSTIEDKYATVFHNQSESPWTVDGENKFTLKYINLEVEGTVELISKTPFEYIEQDGGIFITNYKIYDQTEIIVPSEIDGKPVLGIISFCNNELSSWEASEKLGKVKSVIIPDSVEVLSENAFFGTSLETITIGKGVKYIDVHIFDFLTLENITISKNNPYYCDIDGVAYSKDKTTLIVYPLAKGDEYVIPANVTNIDVLKWSLYNSLNFSFAEGSKNFVTEDGVTYDINKTKVINCNVNKSGEYIMPDTVTSIEDCAFEQCDELTSVKVSKNVTSIVYSTFAECYSLSKVELPSNLKSIETQAFSYCSNLKELTLPSSLKTIGEYAFEWSGLEYVHLSEGIEEIGEWAFYYCDNFKTINLPSTLTTIGDGAFYSCQSLKEITLPDRLTHLGENAFSGCDLLTNIKIGKNLSEIPAGAFSDASIKEITIPANIKSIGVYAFGGCENLSAITFESPNISVGNSAFKGTALKMSDFPEEILDTHNERILFGSDTTKLIIPDNVTEIAYMEYDSYYDVIEIDIPETIISVGGMAFNGTQWYVNQNDGEVYLEHVFLNYKGDMPNGTEIVIKDGTTVIADYALNKQYNLKAVVLPEGLKTIGSWSFRDCYLLEKINIPSSVNSIDVSAFSECTSLSEINVSPDNPYYMSVDGVLFNKDGSELLWCPKRESGIYEVPETVEKITIGAFSDSQIKKIFINNPNTELCEFSVGYKAISDYWDFDTPLSYAKDFGYGGGHFIHSTLEIVCSEDSKAYKYAKENSLLATVPEDVEIQSSNNNVSISTSNDVIGKDTTINVVERTDVNVSIDTERFNVEKSTVYDITLERNNVKVQPNGKLSVAIAVPESYDGAKCAVLFIDENGKITNMNAIYENGYMVFETDHFSNYMLIEQHYILGDVNENGSISATDALTILQYRVGKITLTEDQLKAADVNGNDEVAPNDALDILHYCVGKITNFRG